MAPTMGSREYIEYDTGAASAGLNSSFRPVAMERSAPKPSMHYSHYVDPVNFGYHPSYGQYVRPPCYEYPKVLHRNLPVGYVELPPVDPNLIATRCPPPGYQVSYFEKNLITSVFNIPKHKKLYNGYTDVATTYVF